MNIVKIISTRLDSLSRRIIKTYRSGKSDVREAKQANPFGVDSNPIENMRAVYSNSEKIGESVIIGYINKNLVAEVGETRIFSTDADGELKTYIWLKNDGTMLIGGDAKHMVRFEELKAGFDQLRTDLNAFITKYNTHVHTGVTTGAGSSGATLTTESASTASIDDSKIDEIKTL